MNTLMYSIIGILFVWLLYKQFAPVKGLRNLDAGQFKKEQQGHMLIDVREAHEFKGGHIPGAVNIPLSQIHARVNEIPKDGPVFLYCQSGMRSKGAGKLLAKKGYRGVAHLSGGMMAWHRNK